MENNRNISEVDKAHQPKKKQPRHFQENKLYILQCKIICTNKKCKGVKYVLAA